MTFFLFLEVCLYCYELSPEDCFYSVPQVLGCCVFISLVSMQILISFLISSVICWLFSSVLFSLHIDMHIFDSMSGQFVYPAVQNSKNAVIQYNITRHAKKKENTTMLRRKIYQNEPRSNSHDRILKT